MAYRIPELEVPTDDPYRNDALGRRPVVEFLAGLIGRTGGPFVLVLDSPWGTGKTTLVRMLRAELERQNFGCIYFNAWQVDYVIDPLVALVSSIDQLKISEEGAAASFKEHLKKARRVTSLVAKRTAVAAAKALTVGALDLEKEIETAAAELAGGTVDDIVGAFQKEGVLLEKLKGELATAIEQLAIAGKKPTLVFFVDELDRCRPTFGIELLERIKHLFDVSNILFVLSLDKPQLETSIAAVYGQKINASEYLRRFIDLEYALPTITTEKFVLNLFERFGLDKIFAQRTSPELRHDRDNFIRFFTALADAIPLSPRAQERCMTRLQVVMDQTPADHYLEPILVALLIVLRSNATELYAKLSRGLASPNDVMDYLRRLPNCKKLFSDKHIGLVVEAYLLAMDEDKVRKNLVMKELELDQKNENSPEHIHACEVLRMIESIQNSSRRAWLSLSDVTRKIDLAAGIRE